MHVTVTSAKTVLVNVAVTRSLLDNGVPSMPDHSAGWVEYTQPIGAKQGNTVLVGHTFHAGGGIFTGLARSKVGDAVDIRVGKASARYRVVRVAQGPKSRFSTISHTIYDGEEGRYYVVLFTCDEWDAASQHYDGWRVIFAAPEGVAR